MKIVLISQTKKRVSENHCPKELTMCPIRKSATGRLSPEGADVWQCAPKKP